MWCVQMPWPKIFVSFLHASSTIALICWVPDGKSIRWIFLHALKVPYFVRIRGELKAASNGLRCCIIPPVAVKRNFPPLLKLVCPGSGDLPCIAAPAKAGQRSHPCLGGRSIFL